MLQQIDHTIARLYSLHLEGINAKEIATVLNTEGHRTLRGCNFTQFVINKLLCNFRLNAPSRYTVAFKRAKAA